MPETTSRVAATNHNENAAREAFNAILERALAEPKAISVETLEKDEDTLVWRFAVVLGTMSEAEQYETAIQRAGFATARRFTPEAVKSWDGHKGNVRIFNAAVLTGYVQVEDDQEHIRVNPTVKLAGLVEVPSQFGSGDVNKFKIADVIEITPA